MSDPRPYVPRKGVPIWHGEQCYVLREVDGERLLFNVRSRERRAPSYRLEGGPWDFHVVSIRTGTRTPGRITCRMARVHRDHPLPKFPLWQWD